MLEIYPHFVHLPANDQSLEVRPGSGTLGLKEPPTPHEIAIDRILNNGFYTPNTPVAPPAFPVPPGAAMRQFYSPHTSIPLTIPPFSGPVVAGMYNPEASADVTKISTSSDQKIDVERLMLLGIIHDVRTLIGYAVGRLERTEERLLLRNRLTFESLSATREQIQAALDQATTVLGQSSLEKEIMHTREDLIAVIGSIRESIQKVITSFRTIRTAIDRRVPSHVEPTIEYVENVLDIASALADPSTLPNANGRSGRMKFIKTDDLINQIERLYNAESLQNPPKFDWNVIPQEIRADSRLVNVLINLIKNSMNNRKEDPLNIAISIISIEDEVVIIVKDNGNGFKGDPQELFLPFRRGPDQKPGQGFGIGLPFCLNIIKGYGGEMTARKSDNGGAVFIMTIPQEAAQPSSSRRAAGRR